MYKIIYNKKISETSMEIALEARNIIDNAYPGQFVMIMTKEDSERIPLTIYDYDKKKGILYLIYQILGASTLELSMEKDSLFSVSGPFGKINEICKNIDEYKNKKIVYVAGGVGIAPIYPQIKYLHDFGLSCDVIYGARNADLLLIKDKIENVAHNVYYCTDDGSFGEQGFVTNILEKKHDYDVVVAIGPVVMMKNVCDVTKKYQIPTIVSMNPIMVDGSGMCGACRCIVDGKVKFACIDGPEFDGHKIDFDLALKRMNIYKKEEQKKLIAMQESLEVK